MSYWWNVLWDIRVTNCSQLSYYGIAMAETTIPVSILTVGLGLLVLTVNGRVIWQQYQHGSAHPDARAFLLSAAAGAVLCAAALTGLMLYYMVKAPFTHDGCDLRLPRLECQSIMSALITGISASLMSVNLFGLERLFCVLNVRNRYAKVEPARIEKAVIAVFRVGPPWLWLVGSWIYFAFIELLRFRAVVKGAWSLVTPLLKDPHGLVEMCNMESFPVPYLVVMAGTLGTFGVSAALSYIHASRLCSQTLKAFAFERAQIPLEERCQLRHTLTLTGALYPATLFTILWTRAQIPLEERCQLRHTLTLTGALYPATLFTILWTTSWAMVVAVCLWWLEVLGRTEPFIFAQQCIATFVIYPPTLVFASLVLNRLKSLKKEGREMVTIGHKPDSKVNPSPRKKSESSLHFALMDVMWARKRPENVLPPITEQIPMPTSNHPHQPHHSILLHIP